MLCLFIAKCNQTNLINILGTNNFSKVNNPTHNKLGKVVLFYPEPNTTSSFKGFHKKLSPPVVIHANTEAVLENYTTFLNSSLTSSTKKVQKHTAGAVSFYISHKYNPDPSKLWTYEGADCNKELYIAVTQKFKIQA
ncbi:uncharacterized protein LOC127011660 [Drosophila biarmipes]|uniref:uncharacterized protein LOC127011660 n=1 Tax=Drosophila biarmipes TaxID=125945 RepID=UPI0021CCBB87|nr:uncharacterized protein LOC127011660 [Drosophila biarmipes]